MSAGASWDYIAKLVCIGDSGCGKSSLTIRLCEGRFSPHHDVTIGVEFGSRIVPVGPPHYPKPSALTTTTTTTTTTMTKTTGNQADAEADSHSHADTKTFSKKPKPKPGPRPKSKIVVADKPREPQQKYMKLSLWDTAGQETYKSVTRSYFRGASGALLVFDLSRRETFSHATDWLADLRQIAESDIVVILVGNKADLASAQDGGDEDKRQVTRTEAEEWARNNGVLEYVETSAKSGVNVEEAFMRVAERIFHNIQAGKYDLDDRRSGVKRQTQTQPSGRVALSDSRAASGACC